MKDNTAKVVEEVQEKSQLPDPIGWRILVAMPEPDEKTDGGILKAKETVLGVKKVTGLFFVLILVLA